MKPDDAARIYTEQRAFMFGVAWNHLHNVEDADDAVQDAAIRLLEQRRVPPDTRGLAYTLTDHAAHERIDYLHRHCRDTRQTDALDPTNPLHHALSPSAEHVALTRMAVEQAVHTAPRPAVQEAIGYSLREIAAKRGTTAARLNAELARWEMGRKGLPEP